MAISMLQEAQTRSLAAALAGMQSHSKDEIVGLDQHHHHHHHSLSMSPPMSASSTPTNSNMYPGLQQAAASAAFGMLSPSQLLAANRQAAAAFMAAQLPMSTLASTLFPHHPALFSSWAAAAASHSAPHLHSPPSSPHSPITVNTPTTTQSNTNTYKHSLSTSPTARLEQQSSEAGPAKKARKISIKKDLVSPPPMEICSMSVNDLYNTPSGPISPPSSGSSPNSSAHETSGGHVSTAQGKDPSRDKSFTCKICQRSFGYKHVLQNHERTHTGEKPFECPECHKRFTRDHHLKTHMRLHTGEKPYHCSHCDRQFVQVANLRRHLRVHTGEKPYNCEICDGKFSDSNQLKSHMLVHNGEKPFECERCHQKFRRRHHLLNHKCGLQSPPTPALSPAMSGDYPALFSGDHKSIMGSSYGSDELNPYMTSSYESSVHEPMLEDGPLDLSEDGTSSIDDQQGRSRKPNDIRRVFRLPNQIVHVPTDMPEQTEPEDLSVRSPRSGRNSASTHDHSDHHSDHMQHEDDDIDLDELDDAATLFMRQQHAATLKREISHVPME